MQKPKCVICGREEGLTRDHILPSWLRLNAKYIVTKIPRFKGSITQLLCEGCNKDKAGFIHYHVPEVKAWMESLAHEILRACREENRRKIGLDGERVRIRIMTSEEGIIEEEERKNLELVLENAKDAQPSKIV